MNNLWVFPNDFPGGSSLETHDVILGNVFFVLRIPQAANFVGTGYTLEFAFFKCHSLEGGVQLAEGNTNMQQAGGGTIYHLSFPVLGGGVPGSQRRIIRVWGRRVRLRRKPITLCQLRGARDEARGSTFG
ncbi:uncharacterized protein LOC131150838 isoform X4 [Malania oleifera]|uniref:uncharacterized protein LOC131150838 isoform X4 n=1 Tax=Malania oleifera TaxID=397392 RepID=UPI0025AE27ED|nr:uncharacterized protein LOC131150838 isoform X4 [Malania oleifera]XP_057957822.1 uncharacterized protein LOC131150838 isoform X4 [Malania oleifera]